MRRHELTNEQWKKIEPLLPKRTGPRAKKGDRRFVDGVLWVAKTGIPWRDLPKRYGNWKSVYNRFRNWARGDKWRQIFEALALRNDDVAGIMDATIVRAHQDASGGTDGPKKTP